MSYRATRVVVATAFLLLMPAAAFAYVDPSAGSIFLQLLLGGAAGLAVALKLTYQRILGWLGRRPAELPTAGGDAEPPR